MRILFSLGLSALILLGCSDPKTRPETADKMKPILVLVNPPEEAAEPKAPLDPAKYLVPLPGSTVKLQFHFVAPPDTNLTLEVAEPDAQVVSLPISDWTIGAAVPFDYKGLRHITFTGQVPIPSAAELSAVWPTFDTEGLVRLRYAATVSDGTRSLTETGDFVVYKDLSIAGAQDSLFGSSIDSPAPDETVGKKLTISSTLRNTQDEPVKIGWYVSAGEVKNRRAASTEWELPGSGDYTLIFTVRGKHSRNGDIQIREVTMP